MKRYYRFILKFNIICICLGLGFLSGCAQKHSVKRADTLSVVTVNFAQYDFARAVCGNMADVKMIMRPGAEVHGYEPSLSDIIAIEEADIFIYGGGEGDVWIDRILSSVNANDMVVLSLMDEEGITLYEEESHVSSHSHSHHEHAHHQEGIGSYDEHIWTSPKNAITIVQLIKDTVSELDGKNKDYYENNAEEYIKKLNDLDAELTALAASAKTNFIAVADRFPFLYLAKDYGLEYMAAFSGCSPESDAGPSVIANMTEEMKHHGIDAVFHIELSNEKMADAICEHTGAKKLLLHSGQSISREDFENGVTYVDIMQSNIDNLKEALN